MAKQLPAQQKKEQRTQKKVKVIGHQDYINATTGELERMQVTNIEERDFNFNKVWMRNFISTIDMIGDKKTRLCFWIIDHLNKENELGLNYRQIANETGYSLETVRLTMQRLKDSDFIVKVGTVYKVNPNVVFKGTRGARLNILQQYNDAKNPPKELTPEQKLENIKNSIKILQEQADAIIKEQGVIDLEVDDQLAFNIKGEIVETAKPVKKRGK